MLMASDGYSSVTIERIAETSGVARSTIYRHWDSLAAVVLDAVQIMLGPTPTPPDKGTVREDLIAVYRQLARALQRSDWGGVVRAVVEAALVEDLFRDVLAMAIEARRASGRQVVERAIGRGELPADTRVDWLLDSITGVMYYRFLMSGDPLNERGMIEHLVDAALSAASGRAPS